MLPTTQYRSVSSLGRQRLIYCRSCAVHILLLLFLPPMASAEPVVIRVPVEGTIDLGLPPFVERSIQQATETGAEALVLEINTFGGRVDAATMIRDLLLDCSILTVAYVNKRAISAGALISLACDKIAMAPGSTVGAATPVQMGAGGGEKASEKVVSYWRSEMRATAERNGRPPALAEAMVDEAVEIPGVVEEGKLLTLTTKQAVELGFADFEASSEEELLGLLALEGAEVRSMEVNWAERVVRFLTNPILSGLLLSLGFLGILMEIRTPGFGIPGLVGLTALALFFGAHYIVHLAGLGELLLFLLGVVLITLEIFVIPGFGIAGIIGTALVVGTAFSAMIGHLPSMEALNRAGLSMALSLLLTVLGAIVLLRLLPRSRTLSRLILSAEEGREEGYEVMTDETRALVGSRGITLSGLRPSGLARFGDRQVDVVSDGEFLPPGVEVEVAAVDGNRIVVRRSAPDE